MQNKKQKKVKKLKFFTFYWKKCKKLNSKIRTSEKQKWKNKQDNKNSHNMKTN